MKNSFFKSLLLFCAFFCAYVNSFAQTTNPTSFPPSEGLNASRFYKKSEVKEALSGQSRIGIFTNFFRPLTRTKSTVPKVLSADTLYNAIKEKIVLETVPTYQSLSDVVANNQNVNIALNETYRRNTGTNNLFTLTNGRLVGDVFTLSTTVQTSFSVPTGAGLVNNFNEFGGTTTIVGVMPIQPGVYQFIKTSNGYNVVSLRQPSQFTANYQITGTSINTPSSGIELVNRTGKQFTMSYVSTGTYRLTPNNLTNFTLSNLKGGAFTYSFISTTSPSIRTVTAIVTTNFIEFQCFNASNALENISGYMCINWMFL